MPLYCFAVQGWDGDPDEGAELPDDSAARQEALKIIRDLKKNNESEWKDRVLEVSEGSRRVWQIPFNEP
jgi:hypothetical protein